MCSGKASSSPRTSASASIKSDHRCCCAAHAPSHDNRTSVPTGQRRGSEIPRKIAKLRICDEDISNAKT
eukprot:2156472-Rhodomonas_salina.9